MLAKFALTAALAIASVPAFMALTHDHVVGADAAVAPAPAAMASATPTPLPLASPRFVAHPAPLYLPTGGPYLSVDQVLSIALEQRQGPIRGIAVGLVTEADAVAWAGGGSSTVASAREVYLVSMLTDWQPPRAKHVGPPCHWLVLVVDATDGIVWSVHCGPEAAPPALPVQVRAVALPTLNDKP